MRYFWQIEGLSKQMTDRPMKSAMPGLDGSFVISIAFADAAGDSLESQPAKPTMRREPIHQAAEERRACHTNQRRIWACTAPRRMDEPR